VADSLGNHADCAKVLGYLYNSEILEEEPIVSWFNEDAGDGIKAQVIFYYKIILLFIKLCIFFTEKYANFHQLASDSGRRVR
jgi:hypothetical protein